MFQFDINGMTAEELVLLGEAMGVTTTAEVFEAIENAMTMARETKAVPLTMVLPMLWLARRSTDKAFTYEQAKEIGILELAKSLGANAPKGKPKVAQTRMKRK